MSETKKIGIACAIGGAIGTMVALIVAAPFWWLGLLAGFSGGYVSYEFRAFVRAIPQAWRMTIECAGFVGSMLIAMVSVFFQELFRILFKNPILHFFLLDAGIFVLMFALLPSKDPPFFSRTGWPMWAGLICTAVFMLFQIAATKDEVLSELTYREVAVGWGKCALGVIALWVVLLTIPVWGSIVLCYFLYRLFLLIHSDKRLLCGVDSAIGTGLAYVMLIRPHRVDMTVTQMLVALIAAAAISAVLGIVNYEVVSKCWLRMEERTVRS